MRAYVLNSPSLARHAGRFVWLEIDNENPKNGVFRKRYPTPGLPTYFVLDAEHESVRVRWLGGLTLTQLHALLDDVQDGRGTPPELLARVARADSLYGAGDYAAAAGAYDDVVAAAPGEWKGVTRLVESELFALSQSGGDERVVTLARTWLPRLGRSASALNVAASGLGSALALPETLATRATAVVEFEAATRSLVTDTTYAAAADDRSGAWITLLEARQDAHDDAGAKLVAGEWSTFLDAQAARAKTPEERAVFDPHRMGAYLELGQPERAVPMLQQSERDMPKDYNPPARLASTYKAMQRWDDALAASDRAMALAYGPRKLLLFTTRADIYAGKGDAAMARRTMEDAIAYLRTLPDDQQSPARLASLQKKLDSLPKP